MDTNWGPHSDCGSGIYFGIHPFEKAIQIKCIAKKRWYLIVVLLYSHLDTAAYNK